MTIEELDKIGEKYVGVDVEEYLKEEIDRVMTNILEQENFNNWRNIDKLAFIPICLALVIFFMSQLGTLQTDFFFKLLVVLNLVLSITALFLLLWNFFRFPKKIKLFKGMIHDNMSEFMEILNNYHDKITMPYMRLFFDYKLSLNNKFSTSNNEPEIKQKFLEINDAVSPIFHKYTEIKMKLENETLLKAPMKSDRYPRIQFYIDKCGERYRYYFISLCIFSTLIYISYLLKSNFL